ncbi:hypothetical protein LR48_Vigan05g130500 [Vigna angularis]|uniref:Uncharacterized protein n=1 Tax=Phaseolus angularis TaxID=3914 RepID=A0A0L9ULC0_PHAAN|nr:hypothetical protein LR48_Vigan05g130500 [Vigna angularis]
MASVIFGYRHRFRNRGIYRRANNDDFAEQRRSDDWPRLQREVANDQHPPPKATANSQAFRFVNLRFFTAKSHCQQQPPTTTANSHRFTPETGPLALHSRDGATCTGEVNKDWKELASTRRRGRSPSDERMLAQRADARPATNGRSSSETRKWTLAQREDARSPSEDARPASCGRSPSERSPMISKIRIGKNWRAQDAEDARPATNARSLNERTLVQRATDARPARPESGRSPSERTHARPARTLVQRAADARPASAHPASAHP